VTDQAAILTGAGTAALAVVRIAGPGVTRFCREHLSRSPAASRVVHVELRDQAGNVIDDPVAAMPPDGSFVDLSLHGGAWVVEATLALLRRRGFRIVGPSAVLREFESPLERDVIRWLPRASTELGVRCLLSQVGVWGAMVGDWDRFWADPGYRLQRIAPDRLAEIARDRALYWLLHPPTIAIVGRANVGKSSLANRLLAHDRSIVADVPGTTRDWVGETTDLEGLPVTLVDTPGVRQTDDAIERAAIEQSRQVVGAADLVIVVHDASGEPDPTPDRRHSATIEVSNNIDRPGAAPVPGSIATSAVTGQGLDDLVSAIHRRFGVFQIDAVAPRLWSVEQLEAVARSIPLAAASAEPPAGDHSSRMMSL
jgi:tRNA modification GTPase